MAFFRFLLDPAIVTGLSDAKINKKVTAKQDIEIQLSQLWIPLYYGCWAQYRL
jgi:hypothetical protein